MPPMSKMPIGGSIDALGALECSLASVLPLQLVGSCSEKDHVAIVQWKLLMNINAL